MESYVTYINIIAVGIFLALLTRNTYTVRFTTNKSSETPLGTIESRVMKLERDFMDFLIDKYGDNSDKKNKKGKKKKGDDDDVDKEDKDSENKEEDDKDDNNDAKKKNNTKGAKTQKDKREDDKK